MKYQIVEKDTGKDMLGMFMVGDGRLFALDPVSGNTQEVVNTDRYIVKLTQTFRTSGIESKLQEEMSAYVKQQVDECFPGEMTVELRQLMAEIIFNTFHDGMTFCEEMHITRKKEHKIITGSG